ncbi:MAG: hypothetical protein V1756_00305 [Patescibacteria group bacterium]
MVVFGGSVTVGPSCVTVVVVPGCVTVVPGGTDVTVTVLPGAVVVSVWVTVGPGVAAGAGSQEFAHRQIRNTMSTNNGIPMTSDQNNHPHFFQNACHLAFSSGVMEKIFIITSLPF